MKTDNELIAEFMGLEFKKDHAVKSAKKYWHYREINLMSTLLSFDNSWDWLMPVVEKIEKLTVNEVNEFGEKSQDLKFSIEIRNNGCRIYRSWTTSVKLDFGWHQTGNKITSVYKAVVDFIKWHNSQQK